MLFVQSTDQQMNIRMHRSDDRAYELGNRDWLIDCCGLKEEDPSMCADRQVCNKDEFSKNN